MELHRDTDSEGEMDRVREVTTYDVDAIASQLIMLRDAIVVRDAAKAQVVYGDPKNADAWAQVYRRAVEKIEERCRTLGKLLPSGTYRRETDFRKP